MTPETDRRAAAILTAALAGATPTFAAGTTLSDAVTEIRPSVIQAASAQTVAPLNGQGRSNLLGASLPAGTLDETYGIGPSISRIATSRTRQHVLSQLADREKALYDEHGALVDKQFADGLSTSEGRRLDLVRWHLHQLQDARQGERLEALDQRAQEYAEFASEIMQLKTELIDMLPKRRRK
jgi:hypothetical protein